MDAQQFLAEFGHIANAPGGVARLRELILSLAFKGELCLPSDESSDALLDDIERQRLDFNGETRKQRLTRQSITSEAVVGPYEIPKHWRWVSLSTVGHTWGQKKPDESFVYIDVSSIDNKAGVLGQSPEVISASAAPSRARKIVKRGTLVYSTVRPYLLNIAIIDRDFDLEPIASTAFAIVHPWKGISVRYLYFYLRSPIFVRYVESVQIGMAYPAISDEKFYSGVVPLPPAEEQTRIVAKVDELMALCDKLEDEQQKHRKLQNTLRQATLQAVAKAQSPHELQTSWARLEANFGRLFSTPEDVADLRQAILDLAFTGNISEQLEKISADLVESLHLRKMQLFAEKRIKRETPVTDFPGIAEMLGSIPSQWAWVRLNDIASVVRGGSPRPAGDPRFYGGNIPFLKVADITASKRMFVERFTSTITEAGLNKTREISTRTVLLTNSGATLGVPAICEFRTTFNDGIAAFIELNELVFDEYLYLFLKSKTKWLQDIASRGQGQPNLNTEIIRSMWFPLAPITEQHRIVMRVSELMRLCDSLEEKLKHASIVGARLSIGAVSDLTGIAIEQEEDEPVKVPQTELISKLRLGQAPSVKAQAPLASLLARQNGELSAQDLWQRYGGEIDAFYAQLKIEVAHGWIEEPAVAEVRDKTPEVA